MNQIRENQNLKLAMFDLDNTLLPFDSDKSWNLFLAGKEVVNHREFLEKSNAFYEDYINEKLDIREYNRFSLNILKTYPLKKILHIRAEYLEEIIRPAITPAVKLFIKNYKNQGFTCLIVTATNTFIGDSIGNMFDMDACIGCQPEIIEGKYTGELVGTPSYREGKVIALQEWIKIQNRPIVETHFYSDSINDKPLLEWVDKAFVVNPDKKLEKLAAIRGWPEISFQHQ